VVVQIDNVWTTANFKETQLRKMHVGQHVTIEVDSLDESFDGEVEFMPAATGDRSSLFRPRMQPATTSRSYNGCPCGYASTRISATWISCAPACPSSPRSTWIDDTLTYTASSLTPDGEGAWWKGFSVVHDKHRPALRDSQQRRTIRPTVYQEQKMEPNTSSRKRVLIVGGGFAGLNAAKVFHDVDCAVTVIDRNNYHTFQPLLYESFLWSSGHHICGNAMLFSACPPLRRKNRRFMSNC